MLSKNGRRLAIFIWKNQSSFASISAEQPLAFHTSYFFQAWKNQSNIADPQFLLPLYLFDSSFHIPGIEWMVCPEFQLLLFHREVPNTLCCSFHVLFRIRTIDKSTLFLLCSHNLVLAHLRLELFLF